MSQSQIEKWRIPVAKLGYGVLELVPVLTDWSSDAEDQDCGWQFWQAFDYEVDGRSLTLIANGMQVVAAYTEDGVRVDMSYDSAELDGLECERCDGAGSHEGDDGEEECVACAGTGNTAKLTDDQVRIIAEAEPYMHGAEGPMMNYRYPLGDGSDHIGSWGYRGDAVYAAYRLRDLPLCVTGYDEEIALALTGGGMDLSWEIVEAFTLLGWLPPVYFNLPGMAGRGSSETDLYLIAAVDRSLEVMVERIQNRRESHRRQWGLPLQEALDPVMGAAEETPNDDEVQDGTSGQDRRSYSDDQDRDSYVPSSSEVAG